jgi:hypothetical protein
MAVIGMAIMIVSIVLALVLVERAGRDDRRRKAEDRRKEMWKRHRWLR